MLDLDGTTAGSIIFYLSYFLSFVGVLFVFAGIIWLIVLSVQKGESTGEKILWAAVNLMCQPLGGIIFYFVKKVGLIPVILIVIGSILSFSAPVFILALY